MNLTDYIGVSLGTGQVVLYRRERGVILRDASAVVCDAFSDRVLALGNKAKQMEGRLPDTRTFISPVRGGVISDYHRTEYMLRAYFKRVKNSVLRPTVVIAAPEIATVVERNAIRDVARAAGGGRVILADNAMLAAIGCGIDVLGTAGQIVIDMGAGKTEIAVIAGGQILGSVSSDIAGERFDDDIISFVRKNYNILIGRGTAEQIKIRLGNVAEQDTMDFMTLSGRDLVRGLPVSFVLSTEDIRAALSESADKLIETLHVLLERLAPELTAGVQNNPVMLCGGSAQLRGWADLITSRTGLITEVAQNPCDCVAKGAGTGLEILRVLKKR